VVIVDKSKLLFAEDLVRNVPCLRNRPTALDLSNVSDANIARLCAHYEMALFDCGHANTLGIARTNHATALDDAARVPRGHDAYVPRNPSSERRGDGQ
jgi:hypothetical protein